MYNIWLKDVFKPLAQILFCKKRDIYLNIHSNARNRRLYLGNMKGEVLSLPTFQTSVSYFFLKKYVFLLSKIFKRFLKRKEGNELTGQQV